jgi:anti-sigma-K factor RskA
LKEDVAAYALDALDAGRFAALEAHLRTCKSCTADLSQYREIGDGLLGALAPLAPRPALRRNLQRRTVRASSPIQRAPRWSLSRLALGGAFIALLAANVVSFVQIRSLQQTQAELDKRSSGEQTVIAMLAYPGTQLSSFDQNGVSGSLLTDKTRNLVALFALNLPPPPAGKVYQMWLIDPHGDRTSGGFLVSEAGYPFAMAVIRSRLPLTGFKGLGVTVEPQGGSPGPTGAKVLGVDF